MKILVAEDDPISRRVLEGMLQRWGHEPVMVMDGAEALETLMRPGGPKLAILDWMMPGLDGLEVCRKLRERPEPQDYVYVVLLSARAGREDALEGMEAGADSYLTKPVDALQLKAQLKAASRVLAMQAELARAAEENRKAAMYDSLTGLLNQRAILGILERELTRAQRDRTPMGLVMADIDKFKAVNDECGHLNGNRVLREVAERILSVLREGYDAVGRYGGEEFLLVLPRCDLTNSAVLAERVRQAVGGSDCSLDAGGKRKVTASLGVTAFEGQPDVTQERLIDAADIALYAAKAHGRDQVWVAPLGHPPIPIDRDITQLEAEKQEVARAAPGALDMECESPLMQATRHH